MILDILDGFEVVAAQPFCPDCAVVTLDVIVLLWLAGLDVHQPDPGFISSMFLVLK